MGKVSETCTAMHQRELGAGQLAKGNLSPTNEDAGALCS